MAENSEAEKTDRMKFQEEIEVSQELANALEIINVLVADRRLLVAAVEWKDGVIAGLEEEIRRRCSIGLSGVEEVVEEL